jgi:hypothetical protein
MLITKNIIGCTVQCHLTNSTTPPPHLKSAACMAKLLVRLDGLRVDSWFLILGELIAEQQR